MGTITKRTLKDGTFRYRAQVRVLREGYPPFSQSETFSKKSLAEEWIRKKEAAIEITPDKILNPEAEKKSLLKDFITRYLADVENFERTKIASLLQTGRYDIGSKDVYTLTRKDFSDFAISRRNGNPEIGKEGVAPATAEKDLSHLSALFQHADLVWGEKMESTIVELSYAIKGLRKSKIITKSKLRTRIPTAGELQLLTNYFYKSWRRIYASTPMHLIMWFAIYTGRREDEICSMRLADFDKQYNQWLIRDVKNPNGSDGNHKYAHLETHALKLIQEFLKPDTRKRMLNLGYSADLLVPANTKTISTYFTRACLVLGIEDLRFHDLRHEAATRYAEDGFTIPQLQTITLHSSWSSLRRYVNLKKRGNRLDFDEAMKVAEDGYKDFYKEWSLKQRYIAKIDLAESLRDKEPDNELPTQA